MKGLDTPILLRLLWGEAGAVALVKRLEGEELCTTAQNLFELEVVARADPSKGREQRLAALERLRRKLTILSIDERAAGLAARYASGVSPTTPSGAACLILGALESRGCQEWFTTPEARYPTPSRALKVSIIGQRIQKKR